MLQQTESFNVQAHPPKPLLFTLTPSQEAVLLLRSLCCCRSPLLLSPWEKQLVPIQGEMFPQLCTLMWNTHSKNAGIYVCFVLFLLEGVHTTAWAERSPHWRWFEQCAACEHWYSVGCAGSPPRTAPSPGVSVGGLVQPALPTPPTQGALSRWQQPALAKTPGQE